jgi:hypothetical protein
MPGAASKLTCAMFSFPRVVDERAARLVATGVVLLGSAAVLTTSPIVVALLAAGFLLRVGWGPRFSPLALLVTRVIVPRLDGAPRPVPGPPKRFAQGIGATFTVGALVLIVAGAKTAAFALVGLLLVAAGLEAFAGFCLGCWLFARLMRLGVIPEAVCERCAP